MLRKVIPIVRIAVLLRKIQLQPAVFETKIPVVEVTYHNKISASETPMPIPVITPTAACVGPYRLNTTYAPPTPTVTPTPAPKPTQKPDSPHHKICPFIRIGFIMLSPIIYSLNILLLTLLDNPFAFRYTVMPNYSC